MRGLVTVLTLSSHVACCLELEFSDIINYVQLSRVAVETHSVHLH